MAPKSGPEKGRKPTFGRNDSSKQSLVNLVEARVEIDLTQESEGEANILGKTPTRTRFPKLEHRRPPHPANPSQTMSYGSNPVRVKTLADTKITAEDGPSVTPVGGDRNIGPRRRPPSNPPSAVRMKQESKVIELDSDGDDVSRRPAKRMKYSEGIDSDEEYSTLHRGLDFDTGNWKPMKINTNRISMDGNITEPTHASRAPTDLKSWFCRSDISVPNNQVQKNQNLFIWDALRLAENIQREHHRIPQTPAYDQRARAVQRKLEDDVDLNKLELISKFKESPGTINRLDQKEGWIITGSVCISGQPDIEDEELNPNNTIGSLTAWNRRSFVLPGHRRQWRDGQMKYYSVNCVALDPQSLSFVSTGTDSTIRIWDRDNERGYKQRRSLKIPSVPRDIAFKPNSSNFAVAADKLCVFSQLSQLTPKKLPLFPANTPHTVGAILWGNESSSSLLFASSEPSGGNAVSSGFHKAFDVGHDKVAFQFDAIEAGDAMACDPSGSSFALATHGPNGNNYLRIYDTRRRLGTAIASIITEHYAADTDGEVNVAVFSPDEIYLALARSDNRTHIYDVRMLKRGVLFNYLHSGASKVTPGLGSYGIVKAQWVQSRTRRLGLVTAGTDGCVRLWDPLKSSDNSDNGAILAEVESDIGDFCLGDRFREEYQLVVGDSAGQVSIFDKRKDLFSAEL